MPVTTADRVRRRWSRPGARIALAGLAVLAVAGCTTASGAQDAASPAQGVPSAARGGCGVSPILVPACGAWWGMYVPAAPGGSDLPAAIAAQEASLGRPLDLIVRYHDMSTTSDGTFPDAAEEQLSQHHLLLFSWAPVVWSTGQQYSFQTIASGALDQSVIIPEARRLRSFHATVFLSFAAEADSDTPGEGSPSQFVAAWRHVHDVFASLGVRNVVWVWTTTGYLPHASTIAAMYPGNSYVDWIGYDPYNYFSCRNAPWQSFSQTIGPFYQWLAAQHYGKPIMLTEYGTAADPADPGLEASWYRDIEPTIQAYPGIKALSLWNSATSQCSFTLSSQSAPARAAYRQAGLSPYFLQLP
jgi:hypothetical protein